MNEENPVRQLFNELLFLNIFRSFRIAIQPTKLIIAFLAVTSLWLLGMVLDLNKSVVTMPNVTRAEIVSYTGPKLLASQHPTELHCYLWEPGELKSYLNRYKESTGRVGVSRTFWCFSWARFNDAVFALLRFDISAVFVNIGLCAKSVLWMVRYHAIYSIIYFVGAIAIICLAGVAICRIAALQFAKDERAGFSEAFDFSFKRFLNSCTVFFAPIGVIVFIGMFIFLLGVVGNLPWIGELSIGLFSILALVAGVLITVVLIGTIGGISLMFPAIGFESSDGFDAISRSFSYVYSKPWRMGFYSIVAAFYGGVCYVFVRFFAYLILAVSRWFVQLGLLASSSRGEGVNKLEVIWPRPEFVNLLGSTDEVSRNMTEAVSAFLIYIAILLVAGLVISFVVSFYFSANTIIYALMRNKVDNTSLEEIYTQSEQEMGEFEPQSEPQSLSAEEPEEETNV